MRKTLFFCLMLLMGSCAEEVVKKPENLIPEAKMTNILYDLALLNATKITNPSVLKQHDIENMPYIFEKYAIDSVQFVQSDLYYASIPLKYQKIYETIENRLEIEIKEIDEARKRRTDSIQNAAKAKKDSVTGTLKFTPKSSQPNK